MPITACSASCYRHVTCTSARAAWGASTFIAIGADSTIGIEADVA